MSIPQGEVEDVLCLKNGGDREGIPGDRLLHWGSEEPPSVDGGESEIREHSPQVTFMSMHAPKADSIPPEPRFLLTLRERSEGFALAVFHTLQSKYPVRGLRSLRKRIPCCT